ncbi:hypothetical protein D9M71_722480 [compost metagenome]
MRYKGSTKGQDIALDIGAEAKAMHGHRWHDLDRRFADGTAHALDLHLGLATLYIQQLEQLGMLVRLDLPVMQAAACRDRLAVQQVGAGPGLIFAIQLEQRDAGEGGFHLGWPVR